MSERTANSVAPRTSAQTRVAFVLIGLVAVIVHVRAAQMRTAGMLEHDEAISLLSAAGKADIALRLYDDQAADTPPMRQAAELRAMLRPSSDTGFADVRASLHDRDIHPPLYFWMLYAAQRCGLSSETALRLLGSLLLLASALTLDRFAWPRATPMVRLMAFALFLLTPAIVLMAIELRHYSLVTLGYAMSVCAMIRVAEPRSDWRWNSIWIAAAASLLIWTHFGSLIWIGLWLLTACVATWGTGRRRFLALASGLAMAAVLAWPAIAQLFDIIAQRPAGGAHATAPLTSVVFSVGKNLSQLFVTAPWRLQTSWLAVGPTLLVFALASVLLRERPRVDRMLFALGGLWLVAWITLLSMGRLPPHAIAAKYLTPALLALMAVVVRSCEPGEGGRFRSRVVTATGVVALLSHIAAAPSMLSTPGDAAIASAIADVRTVLVNDPKRGYLFPVVAELPDSARVWIMRPMRMPSDPEATRAPLLLLEVRPLPGYPATDDVERLCEILSSQYEQREALADGPRRRMTLYRGRRESAAAIGID